MPSVKHAKRLTTLGKEIIKEAQTIEECFAQQFGRRQESGKSINPVDVIKCVVEPNRR